MALKSIENFSWSEMNYIKEKLLCFADKLYHEEQVGEREIQLLSLIKDLNPKRMVSQNIENFFEVLGELIEFEKGGGKA